MSEIGRAIKNFILKGPVRTVPIEPSTPSTSPQSAWTSTESGSAHLSRASTSSITSPSTSAESETEETLPTCLRARGSSSAHSCSAATTSQGNRQSKEKDPSTGFQKMGSTENGGTNGCSNGQHVLLMEKQEKIEPKVFAKRWVILIIFMFLSGSNGAQWIQYSIIANIISEYYNVSFQAVDWTSMIYMLTYIFFFIPAAWLLDKWGLRLSVLLGALGNCIGAWIKLMSTHPDSFWVTFVGQTIVGASQMFTLGIPPRLAAVWFGPDEVSRACALGVFGNQLGIAVGFVLPPMIVSNGTVQHITYDLNTLFLGSAVLNTIILALVVCFFTARPSVPPSLAQVNALEEKTFDNNFWGTLRKLMTSRDFVILFITYGRIFLLINYRIWASFRVNTTPMEVTV
ncbi:hypothetical protein B9Z55_002284 [Caenorhabditis nigoni]|uniref:Major facilitator superfamily (MFS) profile domain-containing protein n=1 Tax=Caenorhabditis nigoni TaxID=1611254 RepID=A0A2G5VK02_9PELO|nr:hypothetical protein B9Z55_002284 [Caenorhabditis nigoni]